MRRSTAVAVLISTALVAVGIWGGVAFRSGAAPTVESPQEVVTASPRFFPENPNVSPPEGGLTTEPEPPAVGTTARKVYLEAMVAGDHRALAAVRKALAAAKSGRSDTATLRKLAGMEQAYAERLIRHEHERGRN